MSSPRRPRWRFDPSVESATTCSSRSTNSGTTIMPSMKPASAMSAMRPSMMTLVSSTLALLRAGRSPEKISPGGGVEQVALAGAHQQAT